MATDAGVHDADFLVVAMGADDDFAATLGFKAGGHEYYTLAGAERLRDALTEFEGGRVLVSVLGQPFKCPPAPFEGSFLLHEHFTSQGNRDAVQMATTFPMQRPVPVTGEVSQMFREGLAARGVEAFSKQELVTSIDPAARVAHLKSGRTMPYDLFIGIPVHRAPDPLATLGTGGRRMGARRPDQPQDALPQRLRPRRRQLRPSNCSPRRGSSPSRPRWSWPTRSRRRSPAFNQRGSRYEGWGICYAEFGDGLVSKVEVNFLGGPTPVAARNEPSLAYAAEKAEFGAIRRARWFGA